MMKKMLFISSDLRLHHMKQHQLSFSNVVTEARHRTFPGRTTSMDEYEPSEMVIWVGGEQATDHRADDGHGRRNLLADCASKARYIERGKTSTSHPSQARSLPIARSSESTYVRYGPLTCVEHEVVQDGALGTCLVHAASTVLWGVVLAGSNHSIEACDAIAEQQ